jgi:hypothetical protein
MEYKYNKQLIEQTRRIYDNDNNRNLSDSDVVECIDNMSSLINYLATLNEKYCSKTSDKDKKAG